MYVMLTKPAVGARPGVGAAACHGAALLHTDRSAVLLWLLVTTLVVAACYGARVLVVAACHDAALVHQDHKAHRDHQGKHGFRLCWALVVVAVTTLRSYTKTAKLTKTTKANVDSTVGVR